MIQEYSFGKIKIDENEYSHDVQVMAGQVMPWRRAESHFFTQDELIGVIKGKMPKSIVIGNGHDGVMNIDQKVIDYCRQNNIELKMDITGRAKDIYNELDEQKKEVLGLFHLTC